MGFSERARRANDVMLEYGKDMRQLMKLNKQLHELAREINCPPSVQAMKYGWGAGGKGGNRSSVVERFALRKERLQKRYNTLDKPFRELERKTSWAGIKIAQLHNDHHDDGLLYAYYVANQKVGDIAKQYGYSAVGCIERIVYLLENVIPKIFTGDGDYSITYPD